ncbi:hypothetical protein P4V39_25325 [Brevibacillus borstelensis]|jgi:hypothetical protein|uniref:hypothetical protein n=1 Tax=Brevibacillus borstelensis TaxID=45462 RepID=UPI002E2357BE|nr:hypothetical protein [Brevibacillus borstelensis]
MWTKKNSPMGIFGLALLIGVPTVFAINIVEKPDTLASYPVNEQGQTYGKGPYPPGPAQEPDLIQAQGENGVKGFVKATDLAPVVSSPDEAISNQEYAETVKTIPLYKSDGKTVIGEFKVHPFK